MPRPPRLHVPGGCYHVILRGNHREALFGTAFDRSVLNDIVAEVLPQFGARIHGFCWMTNHLHVLLQIADRPLGKIMQRIAMRYSRYRHKALRTTGHLFERRHKAKLVDVDEYFLTLLRYIHLNPVKAHMVTDPADYPWSSHRAFLGVDCIPWLTTDFGLSLFSKDLAQARLAYQQFILTPSNQADEDLEQESHPDDCRILGTDQFIENIPLVPYRPRSPLTLEQLAQRVCSERQLTVELLRSASRARRLTAIRIDFASRAIEQGIATLCEVARFLHRDPSSLGKMMARHTPTRGSS